MRMTRVLSRLAMLAVLAGALPMRAAAADPAPPRTAPTVQETEAPTERRTTVADLKARLDETDLVAALQALHIALSQLGDGATYVWGRRSRSLMGIIKPTAAFVDDQGRVCRHLVYTLSLGGYSKTIEGIACRQIEGLWTLSG